MIGRCLKSKYALSNPLKSGASQLPYNKPAPKLKFGVLRERPKPTVKELIGPYQCGFGPGRTAHAQLVSCKEMDLPLRRYI